MTAFAYPQSEPAWAGKPVLDASLVLEGGGMRCQFTAGVLDFFMEQGLVFPQVIGVSAGALSGANYAAGLYGRTCFLNIKYCTDDRYFSMKSFAKTGNVCGRDFMFHEIMDVLEPFDKGWYASSPMKVTAVSSNLVTARPDYHLIRNLEDDLPYLMSTSSLPMLSQTVEVDGKLLLDGGTTDSIPFAYSMSTGFTKHVVVLTQHAEYEKHPSKLMPVARRIYGDFPKFLRVMEDRYRVYNGVHKEALRLHESGEIFCLVPEEPIALKVLERDPEALLRVYAQGYGVAMKAWPALKEYLGI
ncbi:MAG: patatin family protein [Eggerthellaceae bacterium]|nr:patatin family protein [Eggerthellaceae bacterium]